MSPSESKPPLIRINRYLARCGLNSRRGCEQLIRDRRITINDQLVTDFATLVRPDDIVRCDGKIIQPANYIYILLNKPRGYITTRQDQFNRRTVLQLLPKNIKVNPVGRLDADSTGVLLLTNDGELHYRLTHPRFRVKRLYRVTLAEPLTDPEIERLASGVEILPGKIARPAIRRLRHFENGTVIDLELQEGLNREIRRLMEALGKTILNLDRLSYGGISYSKVRRGEWRYLTAAEVKQLYEVVNLV